MGICVLLLFLESWARQTWNPEGEMEVMLAANNYLQWFSISWLIGIKPLKEDPTFIIK